jgi:hypothetical protein
MKKIVVWIAGLVLVLSFVFPNGLSFPTPAPVPPAPVPVPEPEPTPTVDTTIAGLLANADTEDKQRIVDVYTALKVILQRDNGKRINTSEKWADWHANTLQLAIESPGKYPGLDVAIEAVFLNTLGTDDVLPTNPDTQAKLVEACDIVIASAQ